LRAFELKKACILINSDTKLATSIPEPDGTSSKKGGSEFMAMKKKAKKKPAKKAKKKK
jgi:hypothetical protein